MKKQPIVLGNWKMYKTNEEAKAYLQTLLPLLSLKKALVGLAVPFTAISVCVEATKNADLMIGAQNMHSATQGAFTGEIAGAMLKQAGAQFVVLGHSERRCLFHESNEEIAKKVEKALEEDLQVVLCVGETLSQREQGYEEPLEQQLRACLQFVKKPLLSKCIIAYEPIWAIGTGKSATKEQAETTHLFLRQVVENMYGKMAAKKTPIIYGGSVKKANIQELLTQKNIDGVLVGGACLQAKEFADILP